MSDHLIAEANRHAKALDERNDLVVELNLLRQWQREVIQNARGIMKRAFLTHHSDGKDAIARAEKAEKQFKILNETLQHVTTMYDNAMTRAERAEAELATLTAEFEKIAVIAAQTQDRNVSLKIERDQLRALLVLDATMKDDAK